MHAMKYELEHGIANNDEDVFKLEGNKNYTQIYLHQKLMLTDFVLQM